MTQKLGGFTFDDNGVLQTTVDAVSSPESLGGWAVSAAGDAHINDLGASAVPATAHFLGGFAHDENGVRYVTSDAPSGAFFHGGIAVRADGAMHVSTEAAQRRLSGVGVRDDGSVCVSTVGSIAYLLQDTFTDTNGTNIATHTLDSGGNWTRTGDDQVTIQSNKAELARRTNTGSYLTTCFKDAGDADVVINMDATKGSISGGATSDSRVVFRYVDASNFWRHAISSFAASPDTWAIVETVATVNTVRDSFSLDVVDGTTYAIEVTLSGTSITATTDGANTLTYTSTVHQTATIHGFELSYNFATTNTATLAKVDNFTVVAN